MWLEEGPSCSLKVLPDDLVYQCLEFCDLKSLWSYGVTCKKASLQVFESNQTREILESLQRSFDAKLRKRLSSNGRIRLSQIRLRHESRGFWRTSSGQVVSVGADTLSHRLEIYASFQSFLQQEKTIWSSCTIPGASYCEPMIHEDTIIFATNPTTFLKVTLKHLHESSHTLTGDTKLWTMTLIPLSSRPSVLLTTSDGFLHFPNIFADTDTFQSQLLYTADWARTALRPTIVEWDKGGCLIVSRPALSYGRVGSPVVLRFHNDQIDDLGVIPFPSPSDMALHKSGVLAVSNDHPIHKQVHLWMIREDHNHQLLSSNPRESIVTGRFIYLDFVGETLLGITYRGTVIGWSLEDCRMIGRIKLARRKDDGPFVSAVLWHRRGSIFFIIGEHRSDSIHEWVIGTPYLDCS